MPTVSNSINDSECDRANQKTLKLSRKASRSLTARTAQLEKSNQELRSILQQREDFVAALTHDLKNPLIGTTRVLELLISGDITAEEHPEAYFQMLNANHSMLRMIWNLLDAYRHDCGSLVPVDEPVDLAELLKQCVGEFSFSVNRKKLQLITHISEALPMVATDKILLRRVLMNLLDNGVKFTPEGGRLSIRIDSDDSEVTIAVKDTGPGMTEEQCSRIFQRFWQSQSGRRKSIGTGLGLYLSKQIIQLLGGTIECKSRIDEGTQFILKLPLSSTADDAIDN